MGVAFRAVCARCRVEAPEVGDLGHIGAPSLDSKRRARGPQTFGYLYAGFAALGLLTEEIEAFKAFLDEHAGHPIRQYSDLGEEGADGDDDATQSGRGRTRRFRFKNGRFAEAFHQLACESCGETQRASASERLRPFDAIVLTAERAATFLAHAAAADEDCYRVGGFPFDDLAALAQFLARHHGHRIVARLVTGETSRTPAGLRQEVAKVPAWSVPTWKPEESERALGPLAKPESQRAIVALRDRDAAVRRDAARALGRAAEAGALGYLVSMLRDPEPGVRAAATTAISRLSDPRGVRPLGHALLDESDDVRSAAREALAAIGVPEERALEESRTPRGPYDVDERDAKPGPDLESLRRALLDPRPALRYAAVERLRKRSETDVVDLLLLALADPDVRARAAEALGRRKGDERVVPALLVALRDYHGGTVSSAVKALGALRAAAAVPALRELIRGSGEHCSDVAGALERIRTREAAEALADALDHPDPDVRSHVAYVLGRLKAGHVADRLVAALADTDPQVRGHVANALGEMGSQEAAAALVGGFRRSSGDRGVVVDALAKIGGPEALRVLVAALRDRSRFVRRAAARALDDRNDPRGNRALLAAARRGDTAVARGAWRFLVGQGEAGTEGVLADALYGDDDYETAQEMAGCFLQCGSPRLSRAVKEWKKGGRSPRRAARIAWGGARRPV